MQLKTHAVEGTDPQLFAELIGPETAAAARRPVRGVVPFYPSVPVKKICAGGG